MSEPVLNWQEVLRSHLQASGLRLTQQRLLISKIFFNHDGHANIDELYQKVRIQKASVGYATVYRTLKLLTDCGLATSMRFGDGTTRFEPKAEHHDHLICVQCGKIIEFENDEVERLQDDIAAANGFQLTSHKMELYGTCLDFTRTGEKCQ